jgi:hypothetical protein
MDQSAKGHLFAVDRARMLIRAELVPKAPPTLAITFARPTQKETTVPTITEPLTDIEEVVGRVGFPSDDRCRRGRCSS